MSVMQLVVTLLTTLFGVLGSNTAWKFYEKRLALQAREESEVRKSAHEDHVAVRDDLRERVSTLENKLEAEYREKIDLLKAIAELKAQVAELKTKLELMVKPKAAPKAAPKKVVSKKPAPKKQSTKRKTA